MPVNLKLIVSANALMVSLRLAARKLPEPVSVGPFTATEPGETEIKCRAVGPIQIDNGQPFEAYIRQALVDDLLLAERYNEASPVRISGHLNEIDFSAKAVNGDCGQPTRALMGVQ